MLFKRDERHTRRDRCEFRICIMRWLRGSALFAVIVGVSIAAVSQTQQPDGVGEPAFDTASIRPSHLSMGCFSMLPPGGTQYAVTCLTLRNLIQMAFSTSYVEGGGKALDTLYDVRASTSERPWTQESIRPMMRQLLAQRFHLVVHEGKSDRSGYHMVIAKGGPKMRLVSSESIPKGQKAGEPSSNFTYPGRVQGRGLDPHGIASLLSVVLHAPVEDATSLKGTFNVDLSYAPDNGMASDLPSFFTAVEEQLCLRLESAKVTVDTLVVDHVDSEPTPN